MTATRTAAASVISLTAPALALRMSLFYGVSFLINGIYGPYFGVWLRAAGLSSGYVGLILSLPNFARMFAGPLFAFVADSSGRHRRVVQALAIATLAGFLAPAVLGWPLGLVVIACANAIALPSIVPIGEAFAIDGVQRLGLDYGRMRMWGSMMFVVANVIGGAVLARYGAGSILTILAFAAAATLAVSLLLPGSLTASQGQRLHINEVGVLLRQPRFAWLLAATGAIQCSAGFLNTFSTLVWQDQGVSAGVIGWLWATAVTSEVLLFAFARRPLARLGGTGLLILGGAAALLRWTCMGFALPLPAVFALQCLHGLTFGATHMGAIHELARIIPTKLSATAQGIYAASTGGLATGLIVLASGPMYARLGVGTYWVMAVIAAIGLLLAVRYRGLGEPVAA